VPVRLREATGADVEAFVAMKIEAWRWAYAGILPADHLGALSAAEQAAGWHEAFADPVQGSGVIVALVESTVVGMASYLPSRDPDAVADTGELGALYVLPSYVGTGLGRRLFEASLERLRESGCTRATLWVLSANERGRAFYERMGWRADGARDDHAVECANAPMVRYATEL
jgi:GNAT superfamily N-acetyltransferase